MSNVGGLTRRGRAGRVAGASWVGGLLPQQTRQPSWERGSIMSHRSFVFCNLRQGDIDRDGHMDSDTFSKQIKR